MKRIFTPNTEKYLVALTVVSKNALNSQKEINFSARVNQFTENGSFAKYTPSSSEIEGLMEYKQYPDKDSGRKEVENIVSLLKTIHFKKHKTSSKHNIGVWIAASSIILIVALTALIHRIRAIEIDKVYSASFAIPPSNSIINSIALPFTVEWNKSVVSYNQNDYKKAIEGFSLIPEGSVHSVYATFFEGICFMKEQHYDKALELFETIKPSVKFHPYVKWYSALCYLKQNQVTNARIIFSELTISKELAKNASEILLKLESIN